MSIASEGALDHRLEDQRRQQQAQEAARREQQQILEDDERHLRERQGKGSRVDEPLPPPRERGSMRLTGARHDGATDTDIPQDTPQSSDRAPDHRSGPGPTAALLFVLVLAAAAYLAWNAYLRWNAPTAPTAALVSDPTPLPATVAPPETAVAGSVASIDPVAPAPGSPPQGPETALSPAGEAPPIAANSGEAAGLPDPAPSEPAASQAQLDAAAAKSLQSANEERIAALAARLEQMEHAMIELRERMVANGQAIEAVKVAVAPPAPTPPAHSVPPAPVTAKRTPAPLGKGQLLAIDMWNGEPSVVVGTGVPGDKRVRVLKPGDVYNGIALKSVDPVAKTATFGLRNGRSLTLSVQEGG